MIRNEEFDSNGSVRAEVIDLDAGTITIEERGVVKSTRPLTADEVARYTPPPVAIPPEQRIDAAVAALAAIEAIGAPVLAADVLDILADVRTALEG